MSFVRESKYRHVYAEAHKQRYEDLRVSNKATESASLRVNPKFFSFAWESGGGGSLAVIPLTKFGRMPRDLPLVTGHQGGILDWEFNPFDDNMLCTASEDLTLKLWQIPDEGLKKHLNEPLATLEGHGKKVTFSTFNPSAGNIVASAAFDMTCRIWNIAEQEEAFSISMPDHVMHLKWNGVGSLLAATCKDKKLRIIDPRSNKFVSEVKAHEGAKAAKVEWAGGASATDDSSRFFTTGFTPQAERQIGIWDMRKLGEPDCPDPLNILQLDPATGALFPYFDPGTQILYILGKGDANIRYFEGCAADPYLHFISDYRTTVQHKGFDCMPKRCMDVSKHEIARFYKLEVNAVQPVSFRVPRKSEAFQEDIYPHCPSGVPAMTSDEWVSGAECRFPLLRSLEPGKDSQAGKPKAAAASIVSVKDLKKQLADAQAKIAALEKENQQLRAKLDAAGS